MLLSELKAFIKKQTGIEFEEITYFGGTTILTYRKAIYDGKDSYIDIRLNDGKFTFWVSWKNNYSGRSEFVEDEFDVVDAILKYCKPVNQQMDIFELL